ncbi:hypothetical protein HXZ66_13570 [Bacillus sp. A116_S68]|jgi:hypothetical protein|nr:hypothetical protein HXZ66_13570 [Bacillus sp. A116_S68]
MAENQLQKKQLQYKKLLHAYLNEELAILKNTDKLTFKNLLFKNYRMYLYSILMFDHLNQTVTKHGERVNHSLSFTDEHHLVNLFLHDQAQLEDIIKSLDR